MITQPPSPRPEQACDSRAPVLAPVLPLVPPPPCSPCRTLPSGLPPPALTIPDSAKPRPTKADPVSPTHSQSHRPLGEAGAETVGALGYQSHSRKVEGGTEGTSQSVRGLSGREGECARHDVLPGAQGRLLRPPRRYAWWHSCPNRSLFGRSGHAGPTLNRNWPGSGCPCWCESPGFLCQEHRGFAYQGAQLSAARTWASPACKAREIGSTEANGMVHTGNLSSFAPF